MKSKSLKVFLAGAMLLALTSPACAEGFSYQVDPPRYEKLAVKARTYDEAISEILKNGYTPYALATCWYRFFFDPPRFTYAVSSGKVRVKLLSLSYLVPSEILLPSLDENGLESSEERRKWRDFSAEAKLHEDFHREILMHPRTQALFQEVFDQNRTMIFDEPTLTVSQSLVAGLVEERLMAETGKAAAQLRVFQREFDAMCQHYGKPWPPHFNKALFFERM